MEALRLLTIKTERTEPRGRLIVETRSGAIREDETMNSIHIDFSISSHSVDLSGKSHFTGSNNFDTYRNYEGGIQENP